MRTQIKLIVFDVNETLLNLKPVQEKVNTLFDNPIAFKLWFATLLQYGLVDNVTGQYHDFKAIARATLEMLGITLNKKVEDTDLENILKAMVQLEPHEDVPKGLRMLKEAGYRLITLTNSPHSSLQKQMEYSKLHLHFEQMLSVDDVKHYKPQLDVYKYACNKMQVATSEALMVAAHGWDITGALHAGMEAAFIGRQGQAMYNLGPQPTITARNLTDLAMQLVSHNK